MGGPMHLREGHFAGARGAFFTGQYHVLLSYRGNELHRGFYICGHAGIVNRIQNNQNNTSKVSTFFPSHLVEQCVHL